MYLLNWKWHYTRQGDTSMLRIRLTRLTVKALDKRRQQAYTRGDKQLMRRLSVLLEAGRYGADIASIAQQWELSPATIYNWLGDFVTERMDSLPYRWGAGRKPKLTLRQKRQLGTWLDAGPQACGFSCGCWSSVLVAQLIEREFGVIYSRFYICQLLRNLGYSFQKAKFVSAHLDPEGRQAWIEKVWPKLLQQAKRRKALILFVDEASFAQWGSLSYTWARRGQTPQVPTSGIRKAHKVFGAIEYFSGQLFYLGHDGRFNSESYQVFLESILHQTQQPIFLIQDGARYHTSASTRAFCAAHAQRLTVWQLPSYSPDYNPIEHLWRSVKREATHNRYFEQFAQLTGEVERALALLAAQPQRVLPLFGRYCKAMGLPQHTLQLAA
jgi:transposase